MKNKNLVIFLFAFSLLFSPAMVYGLGEPPPDPPPQDCPPIAAGCGECHPNIVLCPDGNLIQDGHLCSDGSFQTCTNVSADFCSITVYSVSCGGGDGGGGNPPLACTPSPESCGVCKTSVVSSGPSDIPFTQTCTDGCRTYDKACTPPPPPICTPTGVKTYGPCSATACGTTGTWTVTDSCNQALPDEVCSTPPCNICIPDCSQANQVCADKTFDDPNRCVDNGKDQCTGTRSCDYNWKEVAP